MKKFLVLILAFALVFSLVACTKGGEDPNAGKEPDANGEPSADQGQGGDTIKIGILQDITGPTATLGKMVEAGVLYAVEEINEAGGVDGKKIETVTRDTKGDVTEATNAFDLLCTQDKVSAIVGPPVANIGLAIAPKSEDYDVPVLNFAIDTATLQKQDGTNYKNMFLFQPSDKQQGTIMAKYAVEELDAKKIGVIYRKDNAYSVGLEKHFKAYIEGTDAEIVKTVDYSAADEDYSTILTQLISEKPDMIYAPNYTQELIKIVQQARQLGYDGQMIMGLDAAPPFADLVNVDGKTPVNNVTYINNITESDEKIAEIMTKYKEDSGVDATNKFFLGYDVAYILENALKEVGTDPIEVRGYVENLKDFEGLTGTITIDPEVHLAPGLEVYVHEIVDGESVLKTKYSAE